MHLVEEPSVVDPTYIEDFLLTYRTFLSNPMDVGKKLLEWFQVDNLRDTVSFYLWSAGFGSVCVCVCVSLGGEMKEICGKMCDVCFCMPGLMCLCKDNVNRVS